MITLDDAKDIVQKNEPDQRILSIYKTKSKFVFELLPPGLKATDRINDTLCFVDKNTGKFGDYQPTEDMDEFKNIVLIEREIEHHGIMGQKWGKRNGPPYPLNGTHTISEKLLNSENQNESTKKAIAKGKSYISKFDKDWREVTLSTLPDGTKKYKNVVEDILEKGLDTVATNKKGWTKRDIYKVNGFTEGHQTMISNLGRTKNCAKCTAAYELRKYGLDVKAGRMRYGTQSEAFEEWFDGAKYKMIGDAKQTAAEFKKFGKNTSGAVDWCYQNMNSGHVVHWNIDDTGTMFINDAQCGKTRKIGKIDGTGYDSIERGLDKYCKLMHIDQKKKLGVTRLDNCKPNWNALLEDSVITYTSGSRVQNINTGRTKRIYPGTFWDA